MGNARTLSLTTAFVSRPSQSFGIPETNVQAASCAGSPRVTRSNDPPWVAASFWSSCGIARPIDDRLRKESTETSDRPVSHRSVDGVTEFGGVEDGSREAAASGCGFERMAHDCFGVTVAVPRAG